MTEPEIVLLYKIPAGSLENLRVRSALGEMSISIKEVSPEDAAQTLDDLSDTDAVKDERSALESTAPAPKDFPESAMIFCGFSQDRLKLVLSRLKEAGANPSCLKAVLTPTNRDWRLCDLLAELIREREAFVQMRRKSRTNSDANSAAAPADSTS